MAAFGFDFCAVTHQIRGHLDEGRRDDAIQLVDHRLREGYSSPEFLALVADLLAASRPKKGGRGQSAKKAPPHWYEIGIAFDELDETLSREARLLELEERRWEGRRRSYSSLNRAEKYYRVAREADTAALRGRDTAK
jgi:hypothetical protein